MRPEQPAAQFRYFLAGSGILLGSEAPSAALLAALDAGDVTEVSGQEALSLIAARSKGAS